MKSVSPSCWFVMMATTSPGRSSAGPEVARSGEDISLAMMFASVVLPRPGGPKRSTWSRTSLRLRAAAMEISRFAFTLSWPMYSRSFFGRSESSACRSSSRASGLRRWSSGPLLRLSSGCTAGQRDRDHRPAPLARADVDPPPVLLHDAVGDGHAEAGAGGEVGAEGLEEAALVGVGHAAAAIGEDDVVAAVAALPGPAPGAAA